MTGYSATPSFTRAGLDEVSICSRNLSLRPSWRLRSEVLDGPDSRSWRGRQVRRSRTRRAVDAACHLS